MNASELLENSLSPGEYLATVSTQSYLLKSTGPSRRENASGCYTQVGERRTGKLCGWHPNVARCCLFQHYDTFF